MTNLIEHHTKYKEIHGIDETIWMTRSEHIKLHRRLRKNGKCNIPVDKLNKIAAAACARTTKIRKLRYKSTQSYRKNNIQQIDFSETIIPDVILYENLRYNNKTGNVMWSTYFRAGHRKKLFYIDIAR